MASCSGLDNVLILNVSLRVARPDQEHAVRQQLGYDHDSHDGLVARLDGRSTVEVSVNCLQGLFWPVLLSCPCEKFLSSSGYVWLVARTPAGESIHCVRLKH